MPFEILTLHDTTWQIDATVTKKAEAEEVANQMLSEPGVTGVRIVLDHVLIAKSIDCLLYTSPSPRDGLLSRMPSSA